MGFFDFFKKKKTNGRLKDLPPVMRQAYSVLFPKGQTDQERQLDELCKHFGNKYKREDVDSNLIFILTGYLITGDTKTKESCIDKVMNRRVNTMSKADVDYLYTYALTNHSKLAPLLALSSLMDDMSKDGCDTDTIPGGMGRFGYSSDNPIPTKGVTGSYGYLDHLRDSKGNKITYKRLGTTFSSVSDNPVDVYEITSPVIISPVELCISAYQKKNSQLSPSEFVLVDNNNIVISNGGTQYGVGQKCVPNEDVKPKLVAINYFGVIDKSTLSQFPPEIVEAENLNRRGFIASNNGDTEQAIKLLKEAIVKGSVNAINSLFAVLHCAERYQEAHDSLRDALQNHHKSAALYYNLAVIYCGYDSRYPVKPNFDVAVSCLKHAIALPNDGMEEYRPKTQEKAEAFLDNYYKDTELH